MARKTIKGKKSAPKPAVGKSKRPAGGADTVDYLKQIALMEKKLSDNLVIIEHMESDLLRTKQSLLRHESVVSFMRQFLAELISGNAFTQLNHSFDVNSFNPAQHGPDSDETVELIEYVKYMIGMNYCAPTPSAVTSTPSAVNSKPLSLISYVYDLALRERIRYRIQNKLVDQSTAIGAGYILGVDYLSTNKDTGRPDIEDFFKTLITEEPNFTSGPDAARFNTANRSN